MHQAVWMSTVAGSGGRSRCSDRRYSGVKVSRPGGKPVESQRCKSASQHRGPAVGDLHTAPEGQMQRNPPPDMGRRSSGSELLDWPSELEPPPLPAVTRRRARRTDDRGDCGPRRVGGEFAVRKSALIRAAELGTVPIAPKYHCDYHRWCALTEASAAGVRSENVAVSARSWRDSVSGNGCPTRPVAVVTTASVAPVEAPKPQVGQASLAGILS